jgi:putative transposase
MTMSSMCKTAGVSRAGLYRRLRKKNSPPKGEDSGQMALRDAVQKLALQWPAYGRRRIAAELVRHGRKTSHRQVHRIMREDNLLCLRRRRFRVATTDSNHQRQVYPNLAAGMKPSEVNRLWVADITYIRLDAEFVYLAVVLDACSRKVIGWSLGRTLESSLALAALRMALDKRGAPEGLIHHSDRGVQYASGDYTSLLKQHGIGISMSRKGNPYDNAACESFMKTLKYEEVFRQDYRDLNEAWRSIRRFIEKVYNEKRLHSALGYRPPAEYEAELLLQASA